MGSSQVTSDLHSKGILRPETLGRPGPIAEIGLHGVL